MYRSIRFLTLLICSFTLCDAQFFPYCPYCARSHESAVSLNNAPVGLYGRNSGYGGSEEYGVSLGGAPVGIYGKRHSWAPPVPYFYFQPAFNYWPAFYPTNYYQYDDLFRGTINDGLSEAIYAPEEPGIHSRMLKGSFASASATADSENEKTTADATSFQGKISEHMIQQIFG